MSLESKGWVKAASSYNTIPNDQISLFSLYYSFFHISGP